MKAPKYLRCGECRRKLRHRPGDVYGCSCGTLVFWAATKDDIIGILPKIQDEFRGRSIRQMPASERSV